jgi:hypothetical protein
MRFPADPPRPEEIIRVMRQAGGDRHGLRVRALIAVPRPPPAASCASWQRRLVSDAGSRRIS